MSGSATTGAKDKTRANRARALADLIPAVGGVTMRRAGFVQSSVVTRWSEIVGPRYAEASTPESIRFPRGKREEGVLHITVQPAYAAIIQHVAPEIVERVNRFFGYDAVARLAIRQGGARALAPKAAPLPIAPVPVELGESLRAIADPELRAVLESLARGVAAAEPPAIAKVS